MPRIANQNGGIRASGTPGFDASADYVVKKLRKAGYKVKKQEFTSRSRETWRLANFSEISPNKRDINTETFQYSGSGDITGPVIPTNDIVIDPTGPLSSSNSGCEAADFPEAPAEPANDNGSGTSTILEIAEQLKALGYTMKLQRQVRFAFWGAEELGLLGSQHYVDSLSVAQGAKIYANLNFDMVGSPNYVRFVYDGDGSAGGPAGPPGSAGVEDIFTNYFDKQGLASEPTDFDGRSDYGPFIAVGIPAGGLLSGAEGVKTEAEEDVYGVTAGEPYDACYHQACDTINNLNDKALFELGDAAAHATLTLALSKTGLLADGSRHAEAKLTGKAAKQALRLAS